ncbi:MAG: hypothetical protein KAR17_02275, partial [Cyclobacteriaceae bacterium]|nr:hypothetical protein [Cyclobacteriaceae bacterium]
MKNIILIIAFLLLTNFSFGNNENSKEIKIPMQEKYWEFPEGTVEFLDHKSVPALKILPDAGKV